MTKLNAPTQTLDVKSTKRNFYVTEILMLKSIIVLLILTFFLLNEMQASNMEIRELKNSVNYKKSQTILLTDMAAEE